MKYRRPRLRWVAAIALGMALGSMAVVACSSDRENTSTKLADPGDVIDQGLMLALAQAKNYHHKAKVYMTDGNLVAATESVRKILSLQFPPGAPEAEDVRNDARALLAKLLVSQDKLDEAMSTVEEGLAQSQRPSFFVANLHTVQGEIHEERAKRADAEGNKAKATEERHEAIDALDKAIKIDDTLQKHLVEER